MSGQLASRVKALAKSPVGKIVNARIAQFKEIGMSATEEWFSELCFCILTANSSARLGMKIQAEIGTRGFLELPQGELEKRLRLLGHRFSERRAEFIVQARRYSDIKHKVRQFPDERQAREWIAERVKGLGYKEASHFLRNVGYDNVAILDRHILRIMHEEELLPEVPSSLTRRRYLQLEQILEGLTRQVDLTLAKLDLYLWYMQTGEVLK